MHLNIGKTITQIILLLNLIEYSGDSSRQRGIDNDMVNSNLPDNMLTVSEVSRILHVHPNNLRHWAEKGIIKSYSISHRGDRRFVSRDIDHFLSKMTTENENK